MNVTSAWIIFGVVALLSWIVQISLNSKFKKYSQIPLPNGMTGADVARKMLRDNGITNVTVQATNGFLTDHYNPTNHTVIKFCFAFLFIIDYVSILAQALLFVNTF